MGVSVKYSTFQKTPSLNSSMMVAKRVLESLEFAEDEIGGGKFRSKIINSLKSDFDHANLDLLDKNTALIVQVSSPGGAFSKFLDVLLAFNNGEIKQCIFVTQTEAMAIRRNQIKNPETTSDGHRIYFSNAKETIGEYSESFLKMPIGILGIQTNRYL
jgi:hypothetical protein